MSEITYEKDGEALKITIPQQPLVVSYTLEALQEELTRQQNTKAASEDEIARLQNLIAKAIQVGLENQQNEGEQP